MSDHVKIARIYFIYETETAITEELKAWLTKTYPLLNVIPITTLSPETEMQIGLGDLVVALLVEEKGARRFPLPDHAVWAHLEQWSNGKDSVPVIPLTLTGLSAAAPRLPQWREERPYNGTVVHYDLGDKEAALKKLGHFIGNVCGLAGASIFISYARKDGTRTAEAVRAFLRKNGFAAHMDEAVEVRQGDYWENNIQPKLKKANCLLFIDTPNCKDLRDEYSAAKDLSWIDREMRHANYLSIPIMQVVCRNNIEISEISRFPEMHSLQPVTCIRREQLTDTVPVKGLTNLRKNLALLLAFTFEERRKVTKQAEFQFAERKYSWEDENAELQYFKSRKTITRTYTDNILSRVSFQTPRHRPGLESFLEYAKEHPDESHYDKCFFIHGDDEVLADEIIRLEAECNFETKRKIIHWLYIQENILHNPPLA